MKNFLSSETSASVRSIDVTGFPSHEEEEEEEAARRFALVLVRRKYERADGRTDGPAAAVSRLRIPLGLGASRKEEAGATAATAPHKPKIPALLPPSFLPSFLSPSSLPPSFSFMNCWFVRAFAPLDPHTHAPHSSRSALSLFHRSIG